MSLTIGKGTNTIKIKGTGLTLDTVFAFLDVYSRHKGKVQSYLRFYESEDSFNDNESQISVDINDIFLVSDVPEGQEPKLSISESDWVQRLNSAGYDATINV